jgi:DNA-binding NarL/FixJ family response regulator
MPYVSEGREDRAAHRCEDEATIRVGVLADHPIMRYGLVAILDRAAGIELAGCGTEPADLPGQLDVVLVDVSPGPAGSALQAVRGLSAWVPVLAIWSARRPADRVAALAAGAAGGVSRQASEGACVEAIRAAASGSRSAPAEWGPAGLSTRERQTLSYIACGFTHTQTATRMLVSKATVDTYVARIRAKLGVGNKAELTLAALTCLDGDTPAC